MAQEYPEGQRRRRLILVRLGRAERPMTVRALTPEVGLRSPSSTQAQLVNLERLGLVRHVVGWELTESGKAAVADGRPAFGEDSARASWEPRKGAR